MFRELERKHQQVPLETCLRILKRETRGVLSVLGENGYPYGMPMNHWYHEEDGCIYFHCGYGGHRLEALRREDRVSFCAYDQGERKEGQWALRVTSVIVFGRMEVLDDPQKIVEITTKLSRKFTQDEAYIQREIESSAHETLLLRLRPEHICGKRVTEA